jgi:hypothetical protein
MHINDSVTTTVIKDISLMKEEERGPAAGGNRRADGSTGRRELVQAR